MSTILFIVMCVLAIINILLYTFVASAIHKRDLCQKSPYYHCDTDWICCVAGKDNCDTNPGVQIGTNAYYITDQHYGTGSTTGKNNDVRGLNLLTCNKGTSNEKSGTYYELCVLPVQTVYKGYTGAAAPDLVCLYNATDPDPSNTAYSDCVTHMSSYPTIFSFKQGQCCYQKFDPSSNTANSFSPLTLYPNPVNGTAWNSTGLYGGNNYKSPNDYTFPQGSNTNTQNNSCYNSFFSHNSDKYENCPTPPGS